MKTIVHKLKAFDVIAIGELLIDFAPLGKNDIGYPIMSALPGGAPANFLAAAHAQGMRAGFVGTVGDDTFGRMLMETLAQSGINTTGISVTDSACTTMAIVTLSEAGERTFNFIRKPGADLLLNLTHRERALIGQTRCLHFGTFSMSESETAATLKAMVCAARDQDVWINFDPNYREPVWPDPEAARAAIRWGLAHSDSVKIGADELAFTFPGVCGCLDPQQPPDETMLQALFNDTPLQMAMITLGLSGCLLVTRDAAGTFRRVQVPGFIQDTTVDTTGAGDIFSGTAIGLILQIASASGRSWSPTELDDDMMLSLGRYANAAASISTTRLGGISSIPDSKTVQSFLECQPGN